MSIYEICSVPNYKINYDNSKKILKPIDTIVSALNTDYQFHERLHANDMLKLAIDLDKMTHHNPSANVDKILRDISQYVGCELSDISYTANISVESGSHHIVIPKYCMLSSKQKKFWEEFKNKYGYGAEIDHNIFDKDGWFRLPNQTKEHITGTEHKIIVGTISDFVLKYVDGCEEYKYEPVIPQQKINFKPIVSSPKISPSPVSVVDLKDIDMSDKYVELLFAVIGNNLEWNDWFKIAGALKYNNYSFEVFDSYSKQSNKYVYGETRKLWDDIKNPSKYISIHTLQNIAKTVNVSGYSNWCYKHFKKANFGMYSDYLIGYVKNTKSLLLEYRDESAFADFIYEITKDKVYLLEEKIVLYHDNEWNSLDIKEPRLLKYIITCIFDTYINVAIEYQANILKQTSDEEQIKNIKEIMGKICELKIKIKTDTYVNKISRMLLNKLSSVKNNIVFDFGEDNHYRIQFKNGVYDLKMGLFRQRNETDFITKTLDYDYVPETDIDENIKTFVFDFFKKIQPDEAQRNFTLGYLYYCITGDTTKQIFKMNVGKTAGNGKSTELAIHEKCFDIYTKKLDKRVFENGFEKRHKFIIDCFNQPIRLAYVEELSKKKLDKEFIKDWVDGRKVNCEIMFGTSVERKIQAKLMTCSNYDPNFDNDEGIKRRGKLQQYESKFVKHSDVDEKNHKYLGVEGIENMFNDAKYKNAYFHLLLKYSNLLIPKENEEAFKDTIEEGDTILDEINENFEITNNAEDKLSYKIDIVGAFGDQKAKQYKEKLEQMGIKYKKDLSYKNVKGRFDGIKIKVKSGVIEHETEV